MKKNLTKLIKKKNKGMIQDILPSLIIIIACGILMVMFVHILGLMMRCEEIRQVGRRYLLVMETEGCLSDSQETQMIADLTGLGIAGSDIIVDGQTTRTGVNYGKPVKLVFSCKVPTIRSSNAAEKAATNEDLFSMAFHKTYVTYNVSMASTAKK